MTAKRHVNSKRVREIYYPQCSTKLERIETLPNK